MQNERQQKPNESLLEEGNNDDEESLVRQVIAENPIADVGVREEWKQQIGWHHKENILASNHNENNNISNRNRKTIKDKKNQLRGTTTGSNKLSKPNLAPYNDADKVINATTIGTVGDWWFVFTIVILLLLSLLLILLLSLPYRRRRRRRRQLRHYFGDLLRNRT